MNTLQFQQRWPSNHFGSVARRHHGGKGGMMPAKDTGFHPNDSDWTKGRAQAFADADGIARRQIGMTRKVALANMALRAAIKAAKEEL